MTEQARETACTDEWHSVAECPSCHMADTGYDRGLRDGRALLLDELEVAVRELPTWDKRTVPGGFHVNRAAVLALIQQHREAIR
jgi:hypothetical protein